MSYQKTYMNNIHSSSLLYQLSTMWKTQTLCDAIIRTGNVITKAHRVVLVAACPMLQSMENAVAGSHLEVRLAADIKQDSINSFLQYLYEGFMTLTEDNCKDIEKIARLLQVENVTKCCADFSKCINASTTSQYRYNYPDQLDYKHVRTTDLLKVQDRLPKRHTDGGRPPSPGSKRPRIQRQPSPSSDMCRSHDMPGMSSNEPWDRVPRLGSHSSSSSVHIPSQQPGVVDIVEDSIQLIQTEPPTKRPGDDPSKEPRKVQTSVGVSVASQHNAPADVQIVSVPNSVETSSQKGANDSSVHIPSSSSSSEITHKDSGPKPPFGGTNFPQKVEPDKHVNSVEVPNLSHPMDVTSTRSRPPEIVAGSQPQKSSPYPVSITASPRAVPQSFPQKPYAAGSAMQAESMQSGAPSIRGPKPPPLGSRPESLERASPMEKPPDIGTKQMEDSGAMSPDISIVKVENEVGVEETGLLDMYVSEAGGNETGQGGHDLHGREEEESDFDLEEPPGEWQKDEMSNESGNMSMDQSGNWYMSNFRGDTSMIRDIDPSEMGKPRPGIINPNEAAKHRMVELAPGTSVFLSEKDYDLALRKIRYNEKTRCRDGTPAARFLLSVFFRKSELINATIRHNESETVHSTSSSGYTPLNKVIIYAIEAFCATHSDTSMPECHRTLGRKITAYRAFARNKFIYDGKQ